MKSLQQKIACIIYLFTIGMYSQVGIDTTDPKAQLDIVASNQATPNDTDGILIPRIDTFPATNPGADQDGMLVYLTSADNFYFWDNGTTSWVPFVRQIDDLIDGKSDIDGSDNGSSIYLGINAGANDDSSNNRNVGIGYQVLQNNVGTGTDGDDNVGIGYTSLRDNTTGEKNTAVGHRSLVNNTIGDFNVGLGYNSLDSNTEGDKNTAVGYRTLTDNITGEENSGIGYQTLFKNIIGSRNTANGYRAGYSNSTGIENVAIGYNAMLTNNADGNIAIGFRSFRTSPDTTPVPVNDGDFTTITTHTNSISIGNNTSITASNQVIIGNTATTYIGGQVGWTTISDGRFKTNINENVNGLDFIMALRPVTYNLDLGSLDKFLNNPDAKHDGQAEALIRTGFIAQEVEQAAKKVGYNFDGVVTPKSKDDHYSIQYSAFVVPLTKAIQEQQEVIKTQQEKISNLEARLIKLEQMINK